jgi:protein Tob/BTG
MVSSDKGYKNNISLRMHVEIKVAQDFVLDFLYNKLPRRRVNLFGEELEAALRDKFADHWYPDKPFKGSAFRCLKITDSADPVLNRAARESGNPIPDITENLPTDLAIWIDPGEVSYRIGEKGSVKILYSASDSVNFPVSVGGNSSNTLGTEELHSDAAPNLQIPGNAGFLPIENLNAAMNSLSVNTGNGSGVQMPRALMNHQQYHGNDTGPLQSPPALANNMSPPMPPMMNQSGNPGSSNASVSNNCMPPNNSATTGFTPFPPRQHQPQTYTAGSFAQTKFGSTKLKSCGKKTNRMSPTEFSNYIKQRAMQKQGSSSMSTTGNMNGSGGMPQMNNVSNVSNVVGGGNQFRSPNSSGAMNGMSNGRPITSNGFYGSSQQHQNYNAFNSVTDGGRMQHVNMSQNQSQSQQQTSPDSFFYPLFPDRGRQPQQQSNQQHMGNQNSLSTMVNTSTPSMSQTSPSMFPQGGNAGGLSSGGSSTGSSSASSTSSNNPWSYADPDTETFLHDMLSMGFPSNKQTRNMYSDFNTNGDSSNFVSTASSSSHGFGINNASGVSSTSGNIGGNNSLGLSGNFGTLGNMNSGSSNNSHNVLNGSGVFGSSLDEGVNGSSIKMMDRIGSNSLSQGNGAQSVGTGSNEKYQQRALVAN